MKLLNGDFNRTVQPRRRFAQVEVEIAAALFYARRVPAADQFVVNGFSVRRIQLESWLKVLLTVFDTKGIPATRRQRIEAAVAAGGKHMRDSYEAWITTDPFRSGVRV